MSFVDDLREYLDRVARGEPEEAPVSTSLQDRDVRAMFLAAMRQCTAEAHGDVVEVRGSLLQAWHSRFFAKASTLKNLTARLERELRAALVPSGDAEALRLLAQQVITHMHGLPLVEDPVTNLEVQRIAGTLDAIVFRAGSLDSPAQFAIENRLARSPNGRLSQTRLGDVFLDLPRAEAIAWLLCVASLLGTVDDDNAAHVSLMTLRLVVDHPDCTFEFATGRWIGNSTKSQGEVMRLVESPTFQWLKTLDVLRQWTDDEGWGFRLRAAFVPVLQDLVGERRSPLLLLAESLLAEERGALAGHAPQRDLHERASDIQARYASMVVHEIRNVVVPMRSALSAMGRALEPTEGAAWQPHRERIEKGIERLFRFTSELEQVVRVGASPPEPLDLTTVIRDAVAGLNGGLGAHLTLSLPSSLPHLHGHRARLVLVFVNLLRNAAQSRVGDPIQIAVAVTLDEAHSVVTTHIDDDGPGVPEAHRELIFARGVSLRPGGSGQGLALVREVIEVEMRGTVRCEASPHGGARFTLSIPIGRTEHA